MDPRAFDEVLARAAQKRWRPATGAGPVVSIHLEQPPPPGARDRTIEAFQTLEATARLLDVRLTLTGGGYGCVSFEMSAEGAEPGAVERMVTDPLFQSAANKTGATAIELGRTVTPMKLHRFSESDIAYLTNRTPDLGEDYGDGFGKDLHAGMALVHVPAERAPPPDRPDKWYPVTSRFRVEPKVSPVIGPLRKVAPEALATALAGQAGLLHIHGIRTGFRDALIDTAELARNLQIGKLDLAPIAFCWPAQPGADYIADAKFAERTQVLLAEALKLLATAMSSLHVLAYSHGCKLLVEAVRELRASGGDDGAFGRVVFVGADVDEEVMAQRLKHVMALFKGGAFYYNMRDIALYLAGGVLKGKRAGAVGPGAGHPNLECIDVTDVTTSLIGHAYHAESAQVCDDIFDVLDGRPAGKRHGPVAVPGRPGFYSLHRPAPAGASVRRA